MSWRVKVRFIDLQDGNHRYIAGDTFPRDGVEVSSERIEELATDKNRRGIALIEEVKAAKRKKD